MSRLPRYRPVKRCAFCPNKATSWEHAWPNWALKKASSRRVVFGEVAGKEHFDPNQQVIRVKCVCGDCNGGWMKALEDEVRPIASPMMAGVAFQLSESDRDVLTRWAVKNAMVWEVRHWPRTAAVLFG